MRSLALLLCLAQLCSCRSVPLGPALAYRQPNCDDPETEQAALAAVDYINSRMLQGYKHTLNQIDKVKVWPRVSDPAVPEPWLRAELRWVPQRSHLPVPGTCGGANSLVSSQEGGREGGSKGGGGQRGDVLGCSHGSQEGAGHG